MILRHLLFPTEGTTPENWRCPNNVTDLLVLALLDILMRARTSEDAPLKLVNLEAADEALQQYSEHVASGQQAVPPEDALESPIPFLEKNVSVVDADADLAHAFLMSMLNTYSVSESE